VGVALAETVLLEVLLLEALLLGVLRLAASRFFAAAIAIAYLLLVVRFLVGLLSPPPRQIRLSASLAAHSVTLWDLRL
jgi:hypothetical protein